MLELGEEEAELHASIFDVIVNINLNKLYLYGPRMRFLYDKIKEKLEQIESEKVIRIKASRGMKLEDVME